MLKFIVEFLARRFLPDASGSGGEAGTYRDRGSDSASPYPKDQPLARKPTDLPEAEAVISGSDRDAIVQFDREAASQVVVLRHGQTVTIVVSEHLYRTKRAPKLFSLVREKIAPLKLEVAGIIWAVDEFVKKLSSQRSDATHSKHAAADALHDAQHTDAGRLIYELVRYGMDNRASDIHLEVRGDTATVKYRIDGALELMRNDADGQLVGKLAREAVAIAFNKLLDENSNSTALFNPEIPQSNTVSYHEGSRRAKLRCQLVPTVNGYDFIARIHPEGEAQVNYDFEGIGHAPTHVRDMNETLRSSKGLVLIAGIPGSGKTVVVQTALLNLPNRDQKKLATLDDPVERILPGVSHTAIQYELSDDVKNNKIFAQAAQNWVRGNTDVVSIGEIRNKATGTSALTFAEIGNLTFATIHAHSTLGIIQRLVSPDVGVSIQALSAPGILRLLVHQTLVPVLCAHCKVPLHQMPDTVRQRMAFVAKKFSVDVSKFHFKCGDGTCPHCDGRGTRGRTAVAEVFVPDRLFLKRIREGDLFAAESDRLEKQDGRYDTDNMDGKGIFEHAFYKAQQGMIDPSIVEGIETFERFTVNAVKHARRNTE